MQVESRSAAFENLKIPGEKKKYILETLEPILEPLITKVLSDLPVDPITCMIEYLTSLQVKTAPETVQTESVVIQEAEHPISLRNLVSSYFTKLDDVAVDSLTSLFVEVKMSAHEAVVTINDDAHFYLVAAGNLNGYQPTADNVTNVIRTFKQGDGFGDAEILSGNKCEVSIVAQDDCVLYKLDAKTFTEAINPADTFLATVPILAGCDNEALVRIEAALKEKSYAAGEVVIEQGAEAATFYIIKEGACRVTSGETVISEKQVGDYFGEYAIINCATQAATVTAVDALTVLCLDKDDFGAVLGESIIDAMKAKYE